MACNLISQEIPRYPLDGGGFGSVDESAPALVHGVLRQVSVAGAGTKQDYNDGDYTFAGHRHIHHRFTDFEQAVISTPVENTKEGWQQFLGGIYPIQTSNEFNSQATESGATLELSGGPTYSGRYLKRDITPDVVAAFPSNFRLRNWNILDNTASPTFIPKMYQSFYVAPDTLPSVGKHMRTYWYRDIDPGDPTYSSSFWMGFQPGDNTHTWRIEWAGDGELGGYSDQTIPLQQGWSRCEIFMDFENDWHAMLIDGQLLTDTSRGFNGIINGQLGLNSILRYSLLGNTVERHNWDDVLEQPVELGEFTGWAMPVLDHSFKRIELADSAVWANKTDSVIQGVKSWTNDDIEIIVNQGRFENLENKHLFYLDGLTATYIGQLQ